MPHGDTRRVRETNLRLGAAVAEIEGLYSALLRTSDPERRWRLRADLARAARRLAALALLPPGQRPPESITRGSRWRRRRKLAARGAEWIMNRYGRDTR
jgi:plasmid stabilization system protein ParE